MKKYKHLPIIKGSWNMQPTIPLYLDPTVSITITKETTMVPAVAMPRKNLMVVNTA